MKLMRKLPDGSSVEVEPKDMTKDELERLGKFLAKLAKEGKHPKGHDPDTCKKFAGIACGVVGRELHEARNIWREKEAAHWGNVPAVIECEAGCGERFTGKQEMLAHVRARHPEAGARSPRPTAPPVTPVVAARQRAYAPRKRAATTTTRTHKTVLFANVAEGDYALPSQGGAWNFFKVEVPKKGRWINYRFIRQFDSTDGKFHRVSDRTTATNLLDRISQDPLQAADDFKKNAPTTVKIAEVVW